MIGKETAAALEAASLTLAKLKDKADLVNGKIPEGQLPSYVDDVVEVADFAHLPEVGESGKIYVTLDTGESWRWSGTTYVLVSTPDSVSYKTQSKTDAEKAQARANIGVTEVTNSDIDEILNS